MSLGYKLHQELIVHNNYLCSFKRNPNKLNKELCFAESYELYSAIGNIFLSDLPVSDKFVIDVQRFKYLHYDLFIICQSLSNKNEFSYSNQLNVSIVFMYMGFFDYRYGGIDDYDNKLYAVVLNKLVDFSNQSTRFNRYDKDLINTFDIKYRDRMNCYLTSS